MKVTKFKDSPPLKSNYLLTVIIALVCRAFVCKKQPAIWRSIVAVDLSVAM